MSWLCFKATTFEDVIIFVVCVRDHFPLICSFRTWVLDIYIYLYSCFRLSVELEKQCQCDLKLGNSTDKHVAFKVVPTTQYSLSMTNPKLNWTLDSVHCVWSTCVCPSIYRLKQLLRRSTLCGQILVSYSLGTRVL